MADHERIYLQPECCARDSDVGRMWCKDPDPVDCDDGVPWTEYVRADLVARLRSEPPTEAGEQEEGDLILFYDWPRQNETGGAILDHDHPYPCMVTPKISPNGGVHYEVRPLASPPPSGEPTEAEAVDALNGVRIKSRAPVDPPDPDESVWRYLDGDPPERVSEQDMWVDLKGRKSRLGEYVERVSEASALTKWSDNVLVARVGAAMLDAMNEPAGDSTDRGLALIEYLKRGGFEIRRALEDTKEEG